MLEDKKGKTLEDTGISKYFLRIPIVQEIIPRVNKWNHVKLKRFCTTKETINSIKKQPTNRKKFVVISQTEEYYLE